MQEMKQLQNTKILLTMLNGYEKQMTSEEREYFYEMIKRFSESEKKTCILEEEVNKHIDMLEEHMDGLYNNFQKIVDFFDEFQKQYDNKLKQATEPNPIKEDTSDIKKDVEENIFKTTAGIKEFFNSKEGQEAVQKLFNQLFGDLSK